MSQINVDTIKNRAGTGAPNFTNGVTVTGVATATGFSGDITGNVTGNINSSGVSTFAIANITQSNPTNLNVSGISTLTDTRLASVSDKVTVSIGNTATLAYNSGGGNVAVVYNSTGPITLNVTGIPTTSDFNNRALNFAVIVKQGTTGYACTDLVLNGVSFGARAAAGVATDISYPSGTVATGSTSCYDIFSFIGINTTGSASTITNYNFISLKNGDFRLY